MRWLGRAQALAAKVSETWAGAIAAATSVKLQLDPWSVRDRANAVLYRALAYVELDAPIQQQGTFIKAGNDLDALAGAAKILKTALGSVWIIDPYMDETVLTDYAVLANEGIFVQLLSDAATVKASFEPAVRRFQQQFGGDRPLEARLTSKGKLHDRLVFIDEHDVFTVTQSLRDLAKRSHASIIRIDPELGRLKISAYEQFWNGAIPVG